MEALTIREANLDALESNIAELTKGLNSVINNMDTMNNAVNNMESKVGGLDNELQNMLEEIKANTIINNARQNIMFNNSIIEKKFGYYDKLRRNVESIIEATKNDGLNRNGLVNLREDIAANNPRYWLSPATQALIYWLLDEKDKCSKEVNNALKKNKEKASLFFMLVNLELGRKEPTLRWLRYYLNRVDPLNINNDFITILDLVANGYLGLEGEEILLDKINKWLPKINNNIKQKQVDNWIESINSEKKEDYEFDCISNFADNNKIINNNLGIMSTYLKTLNDIDDLLNKKNNIIKTEDVLYHLIYDYEEVEQEYREENLKNELIIKTNGNKEEADKLYNKNIVEITNSNNILDLFYDITNHKEKYNICNNTIKIAFIYQKEYLKKAYEKINSKIRITDLSVEYDDFKTRSLDGKNLEEVKKDIDSYLDSKYKNDDRSIVLILFIVNIIGLFAIIMSKNISILNIIILLSIILINVYLLTKLSKNAKAVESEKERKRKDIKNLIEKSFAEITDYHNFISTNKDVYNTILNKIDKINIDNVITNSDRKINIGE